MANETFRVAEYIGPVDTKSIDLLAGVTLIFSPKHEIEGVPCAKTVDDVVDDVVVDSVDRVVNGKVVGVDYVEKVVGKKVIGQRSVGRKVLVLRGEDELKAYTQIVLDSKRTGENYYTFAEDIEALLHRDSLKDTIRPMVMEILAELGLFAPDDHDDGGNGENEKPRRGRPKKSA